MCMAIEFRAGMKMCSPALQIMTSNMSSAWLEPTKSSPATPANAISAPMRRIFHSLARCINARITIRKSPGSSRKNSSTPRCHSVKCWMSTR